MTTVKNGTEEAHMSQSSTTTPETNAAISDYLKSRGYSPEEIQKIIGKLAGYDHKTLSDAVFDSIGNNAKTLDQIIQDVLHKA
jgi:hypothetical protein